MAKRKRSFKTLSGRRKDRQDILGSVQISCRSTGEVYEVDIPVPVGREWSTLALDLMTASTIFQSFSSESDDEEEGMEALVALLEQFRKLFADDDFWDRLMPAAFGLEEKEDKEFFQGNFTMIELLVPFFNAASMIAEAAFSGEPVQEAMGKLPAEGERQEENQKLTVLGETIK